MTNLNNLKNFKIVFKIPSPEPIYLATNDLKHFKTFFKIKTDGGYQILENNFNTPPVKLLHQSYVLYIDGYIKRSNGVKGKFTLEDIYNLTY